MPLPLRTTPLLALAAAVCLVLAQACNYTQKITDGPTAYELLRYDQAIPLLKEDYDREKSRVERGKLAFMLGESYRRTQQPDEAGRWYRSAYDNAYGATALKAYAEMLMQTEQYAEAGEAYKELGFEIGSRYEYRRQEQAARMALEWDPSQARFDVEEAEFNVESGGATYAPSYVGDDALLVTSDRGGVASAADDYGDDRYAWTGRSYADLYVQPLPSGEARPLSALVNGQYNEGAGAVSPDGKHLAFTRCAPLGLEAGYCQIFIADRDGDDWSEPQPLAFQEPEVNYTQPAWSPDGQLLYFSSDHPDGLGGYDLYTVERMPPHDWSTPVRMSRNINTNGNEHFPALRGDTLFFSSDGHLGFGGLDVYSVYPIGSDNWSTPFNLRPPLNSGADEFGMAHAPTGPNEVTRGYFTSNRGGGLDRIFTFEMLPVPPPPVDSQAIADSILAARIPEWRLDVYVVEKVYADPTDLTSPELGKRPIESSSLTVEPSTLASGLTEVAPGHFRISLDDSLDYRFLAAAPEFLSEDDVFSTRRMLRRPGGRDQDFELEIELEPIVTGREIALDNIYYDLDKADIRADAQPTLRELARDLKLNPDVRIRLGAHTDCRGNDAYNRDLSQRRAESAVQFLIEQGIEPARLEAQGYGEDRPLTDCACSRCTEADHQLNRRTTFAVIE